MNNDLIKLDQDELTHIIISWGFPKFRAQQVYQWVHTKHIQEYEEMNNVPKNLRNKLNETFPLETMTIFNKQISLDGTRKYVLKLSDGCLVETVGMPSYDENGAITRLTVCASSQVGCAMACTFCATGKEGFKRNLKASEIIAQVATIQKDFNTRISNIVIMGQGEPFLNYEEVLEALKLINDSQNFGVGARHITLSTCGLIEGINKFSEEDEQFTLAISLHSAIQNKRDLIMPRVKNQPLNILRKALENYIEKTNRRVSFEYLLIKGFNDTEEDLVALINYCSGLLCHVNILPLNKIKGSKFQPSPQATLHHWTSELEKNHINVSVRKPRGSDIDGACGQLKNKLNG
jgi:23S rRNA (adenine2503-C2)-methyltransferase